MTKLAKARKIIFTEMEGTNVISSVLSGHRQDGAVLRAAIKFIFRLSFSDEVRNYFGLYKKNQLY